MKYWHVIYKPNIEILARVSGHLSNLFLVWGPYKT